MVLVSCQVQLRVLCAISSVGQRSVGLTWFLFHTRSSSASSSPPSSSSPPGALPCPPARGWRECVGRAPQHGSEAANARLRWGDGGEGGAAHARLRVCWAVGCRGACRWSPPTAGASAGAQYTRAEPPPVSWHPWWTPLCFPLLLWRYARLSLGAASLGPPLPPRVSAGAFPCAAPRCFTLAWGRRCCQVVRHRSVGHISVGRCRHRSCAMTEELLSQALLVCFALRWATAVRHRSVGHRSVGRHRWCASRPEVGRSRAPVSESRSLWRRRPTAACCRPRRDSAGSCRLAPA